MAVKHKKHDIVYRWEGNPIIDLTDLSFKCNNMYNAGALEFGGQKLLLVTIEDLVGKTAVYLARSSDNYSFQVDDHPFIAPSTLEERQTYQEHGVRDARVTYLDGTYYIFYLAEGPHGIVLCLGSTQDFKTIRRFGRVSEPDTKAGALFPCKFEGRYARLERPKEGGSIWVSYSHNLLEWGEQEVVLTPRIGFWDTGHVGCAVPPIEIEQGWLVIYYGVKPVSSGPITRLGAAILDRENPARIIARSNIPILSPREQYERVGDLNNLVFSSGAILTDDILEIYYGAAENCLCVGSAKLNDIVECCLESEREY